MCKKLKWVCLILMAAGFLAGCATVGGGSMAGDEVSTAPAAAADEAKIDIDLDQIGWWAWALSGNILFRVLNVPVPAWLGPAF